MAIQGVQHRIEGGEVARQVAEQVGQHFVRKAQAASRCLSAQVTLLLLVAWRMQLVHQSPPEAAAQVLSQVEPGRRRAARGEYGSLAVARGVDRIKQRLLGG